MNNQMTDNPFKPTGGQVLVPFPDSVPQYGSGQQQATQDSQNKLQVAKLDLAAEQERKSLEKLNAVASLDWKNIPPPVLAQVLTQMPFKGSGTDPDYFLKPWQALVFAMRCYELGLSPFSNEVWFNPKNNKVNVTFEGKLKLARKQGLNLGPPRFEVLKRPFPKGRMIAGFDQDQGQKCSMTTSNQGDPAEYTAWLSEWYVPASPVWKAKPDHMLQLRAAEKCLSFASGIGSSELPDERDIDGLADKAVPTVSAVESTEFNVAPMNNHTQGEK